MTLKFNENCVPRGFEKSQNQEHQVIVLYNICIGYISIYQWGFKHFISTTVRNNIAIFFFRIQTMNVNFFSYIY